MSSPIWLLSWPICPRSVSAVDSAAAVAASAAPAALSALAAACLSASAGSTAAALGVKWAHCVNTRLVLEGAAESSVTGTGGGGDGGDGAGGFRGGLAERAEKKNPGAQIRVVKVVKSPRCALRGFEYQVWEGGVRVLGDRKVKVHPSGSAADGAIRGIFSGAAL